MATLKISHSYLEELRSEGKALLEGASALNKLLDKEKICLNREDKASTLRAASRTIVEQLQELKHLEASASLDYAEVSAALFPARLALTALFSQNDMRSAITDYLRRGFGDRHRPFGTVMVYIGPKGLPDDVKAVSISRSARDSYRPEPEIVNRLQKKGYLLLTEEVFSSLIDRVTADVRQGKLSLPVSGEKLAEIVALSKPVSRIKIVPIERTASLPVS